MVAKLEQEEPIVTPHQPRYEFVSPSDVLFDLGNPRFGGASVPRTQPGVMAYLLGKPHFANELVDSLLQNGYIPYEPIIVRQEGNKFVVVEGNRRLAAVKHILENTEKYGDESTKLATIPVLIFPQGDNKQAERVYLGVRHLFGFREWPPLSKAKFLDEMVKTPEDVKRAVRELGIDKEDVERYLIPYRLLTRQKVEIPEGEKFWLLGEALTRTGTKNYLQLQTDRKSLDVKSAERKRLVHLMDFLYGKADKTGSRSPEKAKITETRQLGALAKVLNSGSAAKVLEGGADLETALLYVDTRDENLRKLQKIVAELGRLLRKGLKLRKDRPSDVTLLSVFDKLNDVVTDFVKHEEKG